MHYLTINTPMHDGYGGSLRCRHAIDTDLTFCRDDIFMRSGGQSSCLEKGGSSYLVKTFTGDLS